MIRELSRARASNAYHRRAVTAGTRVPCRSLISIIMGISSPTPGGPSSSTTCNPQLTTPPNIKTDR